MTIGVARFDKEILYIDEGDPPMVWRPQTTPHESPPPGYHRLAWMTYEGTDPETGFVRSRMVSDDGYEIAVLATNELWLELAREDDPDGGADNSGRPLA